MRKPIVRRRRATLWSRLHGKIFYGSEVGAMAYMAGLALAAIVSISFARILTKGRNDIALSAKEAAEAVAQAEAKRVTAAAGFMISNSLIACKEGEWTTGGKQFCQWVGEKRKDVTFTLDSFGLSNMRYQKKALLFDVSPNSMGASGTDMAIKGGVLSFELVNIDQEKRIKELLGDVSADMERVDRDRFVVLTTVKVAYEKDGDERTVTSNMAFRRPMGMLHTVVQSNTACGSICNVSVTQNPYPSCRGPSSIDPSSVVELHGKTTNLGPGFIYDVQYQRDICLRQNLNAPLNASGNCEAQKLKSDERVLKVPVGNYIVPDQTVTWTDLAPCKTFVTTTSSASAASAPQHVLDAGQIKYILDAKQPESNLEPFRLNQEVDTATGQLSGRLNLIYVAPVH